MYDWKNVVIVDRRYCPQSIWLGSYDVERLLIKQKQWLNERIKCEIIEVDEKSTY